MALAFPRKQGKEIPSGVLCTDSPNLLLPPPPAAGPTADLHPPCTTGPTAILPPPLAGEGRGWGQDRIACPRKVGAEPAFKTTPRPKIQLQTASGSAVTVIPGTDHTRGNVDPPADIL